MKNYFRTIFLAFAALAPLMASADVIKTIQAGSTDQTVTLRIIDATDGTPETGVTYNTAGIDLKYWRHGANSVVNITEADQTVNGSHTDGGFVHIGNGVYRLDLPDAAVAAGATAVEVFGTVPDMIVIGGTVQLSPPVNVVAFGGTAGAFSGGRPEVNTSHWGGTAVASATVNANMTQISGDSAAADALEAAFDGTAGAVPSLGIVDQGTAQSATSTTLVLRSALNAADDAFNGMTLVACGSTQGYCQSRLVKDYTGSSDTATVDAWTVTPSGTITYYLIGSAPGSGGGGATAQEVWEYSTRTLTAATNITAGIADAVWDEDLSGHTDSGSAGQRLGRIPNAAAGSNGGLPTVDGSNRVTALISTGTGTGQLSISSGVVNANMVQISGDATAADNLEAAADGTGYNLGGGAIVAASVTGNVGGTVNGLTSTAQGHVRAAVGLASANLDTQLTTIDGVVDGIKAVTDNLPDGGALTSLSTASALSTVDGKLDAIQAVTDKMDDTLEDNGGTYRFTEAALAQAPAGAGGGGGTDWTADERTAIRAILGIPPSGSTPADPSSGILDTIRDAVVAVDGVVDAIKAVTDQLPDGGALSSLATAADLATVDGNVDAIKAKTDQLTFSESGLVDANTKAINDAEVAGSGTEADKWRGVAP